MDHLRKALRHCKYHKWTIDRVERRLSKLTNKRSNSANFQDTTDAKPTSNEVKTKGHIVIPYTWGLCKTSKKICSRYGIHTNFKGNNTINNILVPPRTRTPWKQNSGHLLVPMWGSCM